MKKSFLPIILSVALICCSFTTAFAISPSTPISTLLDNYNVFDNLDTNITVPETIYARKTGDTAWNQSALSVSSTETTPSFDFKATLNMANVRDEFSNYITAAENFVDGRSDVSRNDIYNVMVAGQFTITVTVPSQLTIPASVTSGSAMDGFNTESKVIFEEVSRNFVTDANWQTGTIVIKVVKDGNDYITIGELKNNLDAYLADITFECDNIAATRNSTYSIGCAVTGYTDFNDGVATNNIKTVTYNSSANLSVTVPSAPSGGNINIGGNNGGNQGTGDGNQGTGDENQGTGDGNQGTGDENQGTGDENRGTGDENQGTGDENQGPTNVNLSFDLGFGSLNIDSISGTNGTVVDLSTVKIPTQDNAVFDKWYLDKACTQEAPANMTLQEDTVLFAKWRNTKAPESLVSDTHNAYVKGYPDGLIHPEDNITRDEVTAIFYRLLKDDVKEKIASTTNSFTDAPEELWSSKEISTMANGNYITGYDDGSFRPYNFITRAEFVTIASKFANEIVTDDSTFYDVAGHWAEKYIITATKNNWISGYEDGTFKPDAYITRAEAMTIVNNMLVRYADKDSLTESTTQWADNTADSWYYYQVLEASNNHSFTRRDDGVYENWEN